MGAAGDRDNYLPYFSDCATQTPIVAPLRAIPQAERVEGKRPVEARRFSISEEVFGTPPQSACFGPIGRDRVHAQSPLLPRSRLFEKRKEAFFGGERKGRVGESMCVWGGREKEESSSSPTLLSSIFFCVKHEMSFTGLICLAKETKKNEESGKKKGKVSEKC